MADIVAFTPVNLITGFLGSGKTTLLRRLLDDPALGDTAVLINEFGEVGLDHHLLERIDETMVLLPSGCLCCAIRGELSEAIRDLHARRERGEITPFRRLVIESTGLADPFPILSTVHADPVLRHHFRLGNVVTTVDAVNGMDQLDRRSEARKQVAVADRLVLTKTDLADGEGLVRRLQYLNPDAPLLRAMDDTIGAQALFTTDLFRGTNYLPPLAGEGGAQRRMRVARATAPLSVSDRNADHPHPPFGHLPPPAEEGIHDEAIRSFSITLDGALDWTMFGVWLSMLLNRHGASILRVKGILNVEGSDTPVAIHGVQHLVHPPRHMPMWPDEDRRSRLVFIVDGLDRDLIERSLSAFLRRKIMLGSAVFTEPERAARNPVAAG
jgi:G3E family GTPase